MVYSRRTLKDLRELAQAMLPSNKHLHDLSWGELCKICIDVRDHNDKLYESFPSLPPFIRLIDELFLNLMPIRSFEYFRNGELKRGYDVILNYFDKFSGQIGSKYIQHSTGYITRWDGSHVEKLLVLSGFEYAALPGYEERQGDCLQFARFIPEAIRRVKHVVVATHPSLVRLFEQAGFNTVSHNEMDGPLAIADRYITSTLLPVVLWAEYGTEVAAYLRCDEPITLPHDKLNIGICWAGDPQNASDDPRSAKVEDVEPFSNIDMNFWSLMFGERPENVPAWIKSAPIAIRDFADTAKIVSALDLVISIDTSIVHLAGSLGVPCWIALPEKSCWRWQNHESRSNLYPKARLFRQHTHEDWHHVFTRIAANLSIITFQTFPDSTTPEAH